ncbi:MAG: gluconate 2-dehydrogenase subunit 3 family protein [Acidobacteria bacterium]|nr:gluconate 2-dehydrogenase subunit 3 family protein [Acidobacteriota bacterium]
MVNRVTRRQAAKALSAAALVPLPAAAAANEDLAALAEAVIPGSRAAQVHEYMARVQVSNPKAAEAFRWLEEACGKRFGKGFAKLDALQQTGFLTSVADSDLFRQIKAVIATGYYTSPAGLADIGYKGNAAIAEFPPCKQ